MAHRSMAGSVRICNEQDMLCFRFMRNLTSRMIRDVQKVRTNDSNNPTFMHSCI